MRQPADDTRKRLLRSMDSNQVSRIFKHAASTSPDFEDEGTNNRSTTAVEYGRVGGGHGQRYTPVKIIADQTAGDQTASRTELELVGDDSGNGGTGHGALNLPHVAHSDYPVTGHCILVEGGMV